jgi:anthranilate synthase component 2
MGARTPLLGVCLGHQAIGQAYGGRVVRAPQVMHGKVSRVTHDGAGVFAGLPEVFEATRYHSLVVERASLPEVLQITAWTDDGLIMGLKHREHPVVGVQFHPESIRTPVGHRLLASFLDAASVPRTDGADPAAAGSAAAQGAVA